jgi:hypothetical protein
MTAVQVDTEREQNEIIQDVIDRLLYLPNKDLEQYKKQLNSLVERHPLDVETIDGIRIYHVTKPRR